MPRLRAAPRTAATWPCGPGAQDLEGGLERRQGDSSLEQGSESFDELVGPLGEVGESAFLDLSVLSVGLSQQDGWW